MEKIRVNKGIVIEVNDAGDTITLNMEDQRFIDRFYGLIDSLEAARKKVTSQEMKALGEREQLEVLMDETQKILKGMDEIFGEGCCKKVFGDIIPNPYLIADFFEQITPYIKQYAERRGQQINQRYNRNRKGRYNGNHKSGRRR